MLLERAMMLCVACAYRWTGRWLVKTRSWYKVLAYCQLLFSSFFPTEITREYKLWNALDGQPSAFSVQSWHESDQNKQCVRGCSEVSSGCGLISLTVCNDGHIALQKARVIEV